MKEFVPVLNLWVTESQIKMTIKTAELSCARRRIVNRDRTGGAIESVEGVLADFSSAVFRSFHIFLFPLFQTDFPCRFILTTAGRFWQNCHVYFYVLLYRHAERTVCTSGIMTIFGSPAGRNWEGHGVSHYRKQGICSLCVLFPKAEKRYSVAEKEVSASWIW